MYDRGCVNLRELFAELRAFLLKPRRAREGRTKTHRGTAADAEGVIRYAVSSPGSTFSRKRAIITCPPPLKFNAFLSCQAIHGRVDGRSIAGQSKQMVGARLNGKLAPTTKGGNGTHGSVLLSLYWFSGRCKCDAAALCRPSVHSAVSGRLHFGQVLCARYVMFQLRLG